MKKGYCLFIVLILLADVMAACSCGEVKGEDNANQIATSIYETLSAQNSEVPPPEREPSNTPVPPPTLPPTDTSVPVQDPGVPPTATPIPPSDTPVPSPTVLHLDATIYTMGPLKSGLFMVTLKLPKPVTGDHFAIVDGFEYKCEVKPEYPDRLYCYGKQPVEGKQVTMDVFAAGVDVPVYSAVFIVPITVTEVPTRTPKPKKPTKEPTWTPYY